MTSTRTTSRLRVSVAILVAGLAWSLHGFPQTPATAADEAQQRVTKLYNSYIYGRIREHISEAEKDKARDPSGAVFSARTLALAHDAAGNAAAAFAEIERAYQLPGTSPGQKSDLAIAGQLIALGARDRGKLVHWLTEIGKASSEGQATAERLIRELDDPAATLARYQSRVRDPAASEAVLGNIAPWLAYYGDSAGALEALRRERMATGPRGNTSLWLNVYRDVRNLPGFRELVQDIGLVDEWRKNGWGDYCRPVGKDGFECGSSGGASGAAGKPVANHVDAPEAGGWRQVGLHRTRRIEVEKDVRIEAVDWGGTGRPLVLLAGLGNTAHIFDTLARKLTDRYHVYGITRRGYGVSSTPETGYGADRLADDVLAVIKTLRLKQPVVAGHSIAGQELSSIGSRFPDQVAGLVYLDAHYPYAFHDEEVEKLIAAYTAARATTQPTPGPLVPPELIAEQIINGKQEYTKVKAPLLAIMAGQQGTPSAADPAIVEAQKRAIRAAAPSSRIVYIPAANHYVFGSHEADVLAEIRAFMEGLKR